MHTNLGEFLCDISDERPLQSMGISLVREPTRHFELGAGPPSEAAQAIGARSRLYTGWRTKPSTDEMQEFRDKLLWAARAAKWTQGGMAVRHLMHYLENTGRDYDADMEELLKNRIIADERDEMVELAQDYEHQLRLRPGASFRSQRLEQITPRSSRQGSVAGEHEREAWYSVGTFSAWLEVSVRPNALLVEFHLVDFYDWDQTGFTLPIPAGLCKRLDNPLVKRTVVAAIDKLSKHGRITRSGCSVTADDTVMNELHLMGLAKNYVTLGKHRDEVARR